MHQPPPNFRDLHPAAKIAVIATSSILIAGAGLAIAAIMGLLWRAAKTAWS